MTLSSLQSERSDQKSLGVVTVSKSILVEAQVHATSNVLPTQLVRYRDEPRRHTQVSIR